MKGRWVRIEKNIRYREHPWRKHGLVPDRYFLLRYSENGIKRQRALGWASQGWTFERVREELARLRQESARIKAGKGGAGEGVFDQLMVLYLEWAVTAKRHGADDETRYRVHLKGLLGHRPLGEITPQLLEKVKKELADKGLAPATVRHCLAVVRQAFNKARSWGVWDGRNPLEGVALPCSDNRKLRFLTRDEEARLMAALKQSSRAVWGMAMASLYAGLRYGETAGLRRRDLDLEAGVLRVVARNGKARTVPLNQTLRAVVQELLSGEGLPEALVFPARGGGRRDKISRTFSRTVTRLGLNQGIEDARFLLDFHTLRHTWATRLGEAGTPLTVLRDLGGWADFQMIGRYAKSDKVLAVEVMGRLDAQGAGGEAAGPREDDSGNAPG